MATDTWFGRLRSLDVRVWAAAAATLMLVVGVMWVVPTTPNSKSFTFDTSRRNISSARPIELGTSIEGNLVDGSDTDFYRIGPLQAPSDVDVRMTNVSAKMIPGLLIFDGTPSLIQDKTAEYLRRPGAEIQSSFTAQANITYIVQILSQRNTAGPYTLTVTARQP
jgi:hypothetical protein